MILSFRRFFTENGNFNLQPYPSSIRYPRVVPTSSNQCSVLCAGICTLLQEGPYEDRCDAVVQNIYIHINTRNTGTAVVF